jgi:peroxiredoxin Q/BCP
MTRRRFASVVALAAFASTSPIRGRAAESPKPPADFTVQSPIDDRKFTLSEARGRWVVLHFLLKTECPVCLRHTRDHQRRAAEIPDVTHVFLKPDSAEEIRKWSESLKEQKLPLFRDADAALAKAYGIPDGYAFHGQVVHYPALLLLDPDGKEVFRHIGKNNGDRVSVDRLQEIVAEQRRKRSAAAKP